jgi:hypothetical protein
MCICGLLFLFFGKEWPAELNLPPLGEKKIYQPPPKDKESFISISFCSLSDALKHPAYLADIGYIFYLWLHFNRSCRSAFHTVLWR